MFFFSLLFACFPVHQEAASELGPNPARLLLWVYTCTEGTGHVSATTYSKEIQSERYLYTDGITGLLHWMWHSSSV